ncbi:GntR family transcriptional regulator [Streptomyces sp. 2321.6]|uniref:GntR family transcriptional regulator n=1 Tax=Streptomyces sp. 2321.6 TaxID=1938840 RepID=UPI000BB12E79|nr:GntR family transcriptional regulator [Streptomyces sp. 2321.6]PBC72401.1 GntR family transcriptional regulator [Streptomyces sp. 2321.6]
MPEITGVTPPFQQIAAHYRRLINNGEIPAGDRFPTARAIADDWSVSRATADKALGLLRTEKLIRSVPGIGSEVMGPPAPLSSGAQRQDRGRRTGSSWGDGERSDSHTGTLCAAPEDVAHALDLRPGERVIRRTRIYRDGHGIVAVSTSWLPAEFAKAVPGLLKDERLQGGTSLDLIARETGRRVESREDTTAARLAEPDDIKLLGLEPGTVAAVLVLTSTFRDADGQPLEYGVDIGAPGRTRVETSDVHL